MGGYTVELPKMDWGCGTGLQDFLPTKGLGVPVFDILEAETGPTPEVRGIVVKNQEVSHRAGIGNPEGAKDQGLAGIQGPVRIRRVSRRITAADDGRASRGGCEHRSGINHVAVFDDLVPRIHADRLRDIVKGREFGVNRRSVDVGPENAATEVCSTDVKAIILVAKKQSSRSAWPPLVPSVLTRQVIDLIHFIEFLGVFSRPSKFSNRGPNSGGSARVIPS